MPQHLLLLVSLGLGCHISDWTSPICTSHHSLEDRCMPPHAALGCGISLTFCSGWPWTASCVAVSHHAWSGFEHYSNLTFLIFKISRVNLLLSVFEGLLITLKKSTHRVPSITSVHQRG
jgi:hypothetical protein